MLPPLEPDLTPFRDSDSGFSTFNIGVFPDKKYFYHTFRGKVKNFLKKVEEEAPFGLIVANGREKMEGGNLGCCQWLVMGELG